MVTVAFVAVGCYCGLVGWCVGYLCLGVGLDSGGLCFVLDFFAAVSCFLVWWDMVWWLVVDFVVAVVFWGVAFMRGVLGTSVVAVWYSLVLWFGDLAVVCCGFVG